MKNNFDLRKFLTENKLTPKSKLKEDFAPSPNSDIPDANAEDFDVATAFKKARVDMSKPVSVVYSYGYAQYSSFDKDVMSAEAAIKKLEAERQENRNNYLDDGEEVPSDRHGYEFENYSVLEEDMPEGHEYKLSYYLDGDYTYSVTQEKSGVSEKKVNENEEEMFDGVHGINIDDDIPSSKAAGISIYVLESSSAADTYYFGIIDGEGNKKIVSVEVGGGPVNVDDIEKGVVPHEVASDIVDFINDEVSLSEKNKNTVNEQLAAQAVQEFIAADNNGVSIAEFVKAIIDSAAEFNQEDAAYQDLDKRSEVILKAIGRQDLIGGTNETAPGYMHDCAAKVMHEKYGNGDCIPEEHTLVKEGNKYVVTHYDVLFESGKTVKNIPVGELKIITESHHGHKRRKK